jgi:hypothetical protein
MVLSIEERVFLVEYIFREGSRYADLVQEHFAEKFPETPAPHCNAVRRLIEKLRETDSVLDAECLKSRSTVQKRVGSDLYRSS